MKREDIPPNTPEYRWTAVSTKGLVVAMFAHWKKLPAAEVERIHKSVGSAHAACLRRNAGQDRSAHGSTKNSPLFGLSLESFRDLRHAHFRRLIAAAVEANDCAFFVRLGEALRRKPKADAEIAPADVDGFLIHNWFFRRTSKPKPDLFNAPLACLSPRVLAKVVSCFFPKEKATAGSVDRRAKRLGLMRASFQFDCAEPRKAGGFLVS